MVTMTLISGHYEIVEEPKVEKKIKKGGEINDSFNKRSKVWEAGSSLGTDRVDSGSK